MSPMTICIITCIRIAHVLDDLAVSRWQQVGCRRIGPVRLIRDGDARTVLKHAVAGIDAAVSDPNDLVLSEQAQVPCDLSDLLASAE